MRDISLHLLDLAQNSITAGARHVSLSLVLAADGLLTITLADDGKGMAPELLKRVQSPFATTRKTRKVGLGIPMAMENARLTGGDLTIQSEVGQGTTLTLTFHTRHIDCLPLGDLAGTVASLVLANPEQPEFSLLCRSPAGEMSFDTAQVRAALGGVALNEPEVVAWLTQSLQEEIQPIFGGVMI